MKIDISEIEKEIGTYIDINIEREISPLEFLGEDIKFLEPIYFIGKAVNTGDFIVIEGTIKSLLELQCHRCLEKFKLPIKVELNEECPLNSRIQSDEVHLEVKDHIIDIMDVIKNAVLLNLPMKRLCDEKCKGICEQCGRNLNKEECNCRKDEIDPRLDILKKLFVEGEDVD
ncbi:hypothetical protein H0A61_02221 [Koleobacter methoxysyntrophicus]|jgi:uncharacterized protein|uniref:DUF177 domain-containing protein n=1 Tax=Koleobacter methoxysyntrophicus TaxID=2751313 RepID=A0A8A0RQJ6_9FIRM|nr:DUF177 domain-containing protein [Koleobacter methoxysyntrophicus]MDK2901394.1 hypothetical protein [Thermosediminibacterales bacterium]QSQ09840.1 hypothetical protein H0A61_02221 [Koleobacter methoxysyntrophicus]